MKLIDFSNKVVDKFVFSVVCKLDTFRNGMYIDR